MNFFLVLETLLFAGIILKINKANKEDDLMALSLWIGILSFLTVFTVSFLIIYTIIKGGI